MFEPSYSMVYTGRKEEKKTRNMNTIPRGYYSFRLVLKLSEEIMH